MTSFKANLISWERPETVLSTLDAILSVIMLNVITPNIMAPIECLSLALFCHVKLNRWHYTFWSVFCQISQWQFGRHKKRLVPFLTIFHCRFLASPITKYRIKTIETDYRVILYIFIFCRFYPILGNWRRMKTTQKER